MKRSNQLVLESAVIAGVLIALTLGGSVATTSFPPAFTNLQNPGNVKEAHDLGALAVYYNTTLTQIGSQKYANASFLLATFEFVNISPGVNATAQAANSDLASVNATAPQAVLLFHEARAAIGEKQYVNATAMVAEGCALAGAANASLADFQGPQTSRLRSESVPVAEYSVGSGAASALVNSLLAECSTLQTELTFSGQNSPVLLIGSPQTVVETGGDLAITGNLTLGGSPLPDQSVLFYVNGTYVGTLSTDPRGDLAGTLRIPFLYTQWASVQALAPANPAAKAGGATSNVLLFEVLFNQTAIVIGDPPAVLPTFSFNVQGSLTTVTGSPLPGAPVEVTFFGQSQYLSTNDLGVFSTRLTVPANASDGIYDVYARFAPQGVFGPSVNFTSVQVIHLPLQLTVSTPSLTIAGFSIVVTGRASANGSAIPGALVRVSSPGGSGTATTDSSGRYEVRVRISPYEFAFSAQVTATAASLPPYVAPATATSTLGLFNILLITVPAAGVGIVGYEADKLGIFSGARKKRRLAPMVEEATQEAFGELEMAKKGDELVRLYLKALRLASAKLQVGFRRSQTLREVLEEVGAKGAGKGLEPFASIVMALEDFAYGASFDSGRVEEARKSLAELEREWG